MSLEKGIDSTRSAAVFWRSAGELRVLFAIAAYTVLCALTLSPLLWASVPPLVDYPNHLARMWILVHGSENYVASWHLLPSLAMDLVVPLLAQIMAVETAGRVFLALTMMLLVIATVVLHRVLHGRVGLWPLSSLLFVYNVALYWGFLNFLFGLSVALLGFSGWVASERWHTITRVALFSVVASLVFILHLFAFGIYGLLVGSYELGNMLADRRWSLKSIAVEAAKFAHFGPVALLLLASLSTAESGYTSYGSGISKLYALGAPMAFGVAAQICGVLSMGLFYIGWRTGALKLIPAMRLPILAIIVTAVLIPNWLFGSWMADIRLPVALPFVLIASTRLDIRRERVVGLLAASALVFLGIRVYALTLTWRDVDSRFAEFRAVSRSIPRGIRLLIVETDIPDKDRRVDGMPLALASLESVHFYHMPSLTVMDRDVLIPYLFTGWQTTVKPAPQNAGTFESQGIPLKPAELVESVSPEWRQRYAGLRNRLGELHYARDWPQKFDYVLWIDFGQRRELLPEMLQLVANGSFFQIYKIVR